MAKLACPAFLGAERVGLPEQTYDRGGVAMKKRSAAVRRIKVCTAVLFTLCILALASSAQAAIVFYDDFEDGNHDGWLVSTTGGTGSTSVVNHNLSQMAYVTHSGGAKHSLSHDFSYVPSDILSFDMHAITGGGGRGTIAWAGVTISFLDWINSPLGRVRLLNTNDQTTLGQNDYYIDNTQHFYENTWDFYSSLAGLGASDPITTVGLEFWVAGQSNITSHSWGQVWFDNVKVETVPIPSAVLLLGSGLMGLLGVTRLKRRPC